MIDGKGKTFAKIEREDLFSDDYEKLIQVKPRTLIVVYKKQLKHRTQNCP